MPTWYKLPRPTLCSSSTCTPSVGLLVCMAYTGKVGPWALQTHEVTFSISAPRTSQRRLLARLAVAVLSLPSSLSPSSRMKFSRHSLLPAVDLETVQASRSTNPLHSCFLPQRNWSCRSDKEFDYQRILPRQVCDSPHLWDGTLFPDSPRVCGVRLV